MTKQLLIVLAVLALAGCTPGSYDQTPVMVRIVSVRTQAEYNAASNWEYRLYPSTVVERLDTKERVMLRYDTWGKVGDEFAIKQCNLHW
jgi:hypothetical protein